MESRIDTSVAHSARIYDYVLGGKDNYEADRAAADQALNPQLMASMQANRQCMRRMVFTLATEYGIRQFLDIGTGLPTSPNLHEVVQHVAPASSVVYVDNDPIVLLHAESLLTSAPDGKTAYVEADMHQPETLLTHPDLHRTLDLTQPVAVTVIAMIHFVADAQGLIDALMAPLPSGSYLAATVCTADYVEGSYEMADTYAAQGIPVYLRDRQETENLFHGLELVPPGIQPSTRWRPGEETDQDLSIAGMYAGIGRKP